MFGNGLGWGLSAGVCAVMSFLIYLVIMPTQTTPPTNAPVLAVANAEVALPAAPGTVADPGTSDCDAADLYRKAIESYDKNERLYERYFQNRDTTPRSKLEIVDLVLKARDCRNCNLFRNKPETVINFNNTQPPLESLEKIGEFCCTYGLLVKDSKPDEAKKVWEAAFILGDRLYEERLAWEELRVGLATMETAAIGLEKYYTKVNDKPRQTTVHDFLDKEQAYKIKLVDAIRIIGGISEPHFGRYAGDILKIAQSSNADPMFRVEALKHMGHYRYNALNIGDQRAVPRILIKMLNDPALPASVKTGAKAADDLTIDKHNMYGGNA